MKTPLKKLISFANIKTLLLVGFFTHIAATVTVLIIGRSGKFPKLINESGALWKDAILYTEKCSFWSQKIAEGDFSLFFTRAEQLHVKIYTVFYFLLSPVLGENILCFEPLNAPLFLLILFFVYKIGETCFDRRTGLLAALIISFFPTFLLHSTQPLRDSFFILLFLTIINCQIFLLRKNSSIRKFSAYLFLCYVLFIFIYLVRDSGFPGYAGIVIFTLICFIFKYRQTFRSHFQKIILIGCLAGAVLCIPFIFRSVLPKKIIFDDTQLDEIRHSRSEWISRGVPEYLIKVNLIRNDFIIQQEGSGGSVIDGDVIFNSLGELVMYTPRAALIGFFAPFPDMWFEEGKSFGKTGRLISAGETSIIYFLSIFAIVTLFYYRKSIEVWLLFTIIISGIVPLGFLVTNVGALYRLRYVFWFLIIIIGTKGFLTALEFLTKNKSFGLFKVKIKVKSDSLEN